MKNAMLRNRFGEPVEDLTFLDHVYGLKERLPPGPVKFGAAAFGAGAEAVNAIAQIGKELGASALRSYVAQEGPPIYDDAGQYVSGAYMRATDGLDAASIAPLGTLGARATGLSTDVGDLGAFAGKVAAENLRKQGVQGPAEALAMAERLRADGASPTAIYEATSKHLDGTPYAGVHYGADGKPRFEISDQGLAVDAGEPRNAMLGFGRPYWDKQQTGLSGPFVSHPELEKAYPGAFDDLTIRLRASDKQQRGGGMNRKGTLVEAHGNTRYRDDADAGFLRSAMAHELSGHKVQEIEGFSGGTNPAYMKGHPEYQKKRGTDAAMDAFIGLPPPEAQLYQRAKGEVEARNVQERRDMSPSELRATPPWKTQDTPYRNQVDVPSGFVSAWNRRMPLKFGGKEAWETKQAGTRLDAKTGNPPEWDNVYDVDGTLLSSYGLAMDETSRMARASELGFDTSTRYWDVNPPTYAPAGNIDPNITGPFTSIEELAYPGVPPVFLKDARALSNSNHAVEVSQPSHVRNTDAKFGLSKEDRRSGVRYFANSAESSSVPLGMKALEQGEGIRAYHGSPYDFDRFDASKIGTGEGAQAFGHGHYFAESEGVARSYRDGLASKGDKVLYDGEELDKYRVAAKSIMDTYKGDREAALNILELSRRSPAADDAWKSSVDGQMELIRNADLEKFETVKNPGRMYEVSINAKPEDFLDWDAPLSGQSPAVREALEAAYKEASEKADYRVPLQTTEPVSEHYLSLSNALGRLPGGWGSKNQTRASEDLAGRGIPGIRYLDQMSRGAGEGTRNYVVFPGNEHLISIIRKYGIAAATALFGAEAVDGAFGGGNAMAASHGGQAPAASNYPLIPPHADPFERMNDPFGEVPDILEYPFGAPPPGSPNNLPPAFPNPLPPQRRLYNPTG